MPSQEVTRKVEIVRELLQKLSVLDADSLARRSELGSMSFESLQDDFVGILAIVNELKAVDIHSLPFPILERLRVTLSQVEQAIGSVQSFSLNVQNANEARQPISQKVGEGHAKLLEVAAPLISFALLRKGRVGEAVEGLSAKLGTAHEYVEKMKELTVQAGSALEKIRDVSGLTGIAAHSTEFGLEAERCDKAAGRWLAVALILGLATAGLAYFLFEGQLSGAAAVWEGGHAVRSLAFRLVLLSFFTYFVTWAARSYRANRHNHIVNTHRKLALSTFETFAKAAEGDKDTKNAVLLQATQAIFSAQRSGYLDREPDVAPQNTIVEMLRRSHAEKS